MFRIYLSIYMIIGFILLLIILFYDDRENGKLSFDDYNIAELLIASAILIMVLPFAFIYSMFPIIYKKYKKSNKNPK